MRLTVSRIARAALTGGAILGCALALAAQGPPPGFNLGRGGFGPGFGPGFGGPGGRGFAFGRVVTNSPFSAQAVSTQQRPLTDGDQINHTVTVSIARDADGRTWLQATEPVGGRGVAPGTTQTVIYIDDPVAHMSYVVYPAKQTAISHQLPTPHPGGRGTPPAGTTPRTPPSRPNGPVVASLGTKTLDGVAVTGTSITTTIPAGQDGNAQPIVSVRTEWYSAQLQMVVSSTDTDPRLGVSTFNLQTVTTVEPNPSLFTVPSNYKITSAGRGGRGRGGPGGGGAR